MHIILGLISFIGVILFAIWRINLALQASREIVDAAQDAKGFFRRRKWNKKVNADLIQQIEDPREAATAMMVAVAETDGPMTESERTQILDIITGTFEATSKQAIELLAHGRWISKDAGDLTSYLGRFKKIIMKTCDEQQKAELIEMLYKVGKADGSISDEVEYSLQYVRRSINI